MVFIVSMATILLLRVHVYKVSTDYQILFKLVVCVHVYTLEISLLYELCSYHKTRPIKAPSTQHLYRRATQSHSLSESLVLPHEWKAWEFIYNHKVFQWKQKLNEYWKPHIYMDASLISISTLALITISHIQRVYIIIERLQTSS